MSERIDLMILEKEKYKDFQLKIDNMKKYNIGTLYISVDIKTLSEARGEMVKDDFTTRLFVAKIAGENIFYIYGKKKGKKGTFNAHCKNTFYEYETKEDFLTHIIETSSNESELIVSDSLDVISISKKLKRETKSYGE